MENQEVHRRDFLRTTAAGAAAGAGWWYAVGVALCALVLLYENAIVRPGDTRRVQAAFAQSNGLLAVVFLAVTLADVTL